jgi:hypothetical protein
VSAPLCGDFILCFAPVGETCGRPPDLVRCFIQRRRGRVPRPLRYDVVNLCDGFDESVMEGVARAAEDSGPYIKSGGLLRCRGRCPIAFCEAKRAIIPQCGMTRHRQSRCPDPAVPCCKFVQWVRRIRHRMVQHGGVRARRPTGCDFSFELIPYRFSSPASAPTGSTCRPADPG